MNLSIIKKLRKEQGLSQKNLANILNVSPSYIQKIESNKKNPSISTLEKLSSALNVELSLLLNDDKNKNKNLHFDSGINLPDNIPLNLLMEFSEYIDKDISLADKLDDIYLLESLYKYEFKNLKDTYEDRISKLDDENRKLRLSLAYLEAENKKLNNKLDDISSSQKEKIENCISNTFNASFNASLVSDNEDEYDDDLYNEAKDLYGCRF